MKPESWKKLWPWQRNKPRVQNIERIDGELVILRAKRMEDVPADYTWRTDPELSHLDATRPINLTMREYGRFQQDELQFPSPWSVRLAIDTRNGQHIGNCMYYDIDFNQGKAELGIMIGDRDHWSQGYGEDAVRTLLRHIFTDTPITLVYLHTLTKNLRAQRCFTKAGFRPVGEARRDGYDFVKMEILRSDWAADNLDALHDEHAANPNAQRASA